jgi:hypothetical protein
MEQGAAIERARPHALMGALQRGAGTGASAPRPRRHGPSWRRK